MEAWVVGGTSGIGAAVVEALKDRGVRALIMSEDVDAGPRYHERSQHFELLDLAAPLERVGSRAQQLLEQYGLPIYLFVSAGLTREIAAIDTSEADWMLLAHVNLLGIAQLCNTVARAWRDDPQDEWQRHIVILGSANAMRPLPSQGAYSVMKAGLHAYAKCLSNDVAASRVRVNVVVPGAIWTPMNEPLFPDNPSDPGRRRVAESALAGRWGDAKEVAAVAVWTALDSPSFLMGTEVTVDGGFLAKR